MDDPEGTLTRNVASTPTAVDVLDLLQRGDKAAAIAWLFEAYGPSIFAFCAHMLGDRVLAEDIAQQVFVEAQRDIGRFAGRSSLSTWLRGIANHRCKDAIKSRNRRDHRLQYDELELQHAVDPAATPEQRVAHLQELVALTDCLQTLSPEVRMSVLLRFHTELTYDELSDVLDAKPDALHARVARALPVLRRCLETKGWRR